ncbi:uncharacterized protein LOC123298445 [Chrysoperla carnea]|uniref:uncharacterized protein LOC123298445 n=1 Tax=Chrysoperla carnea TaxID=189513 RepID=UPI001D08A729|nr:uncharacterized protein LOC123298445 [Chrysoperla carnea]
MFLLLRIFSALCVLLLANSLIIPEELPSILSLIYSNIPPIKKGTDSRVGFGFRLGEHADFQVLLELGPQTNTRPIGNADSPSKRHVQRINSNIIQLLQRPSKPTPEKISNTDGGKWLANWQQTMKKPVFVSEEESVEGLGEIKAADVIPEDDGDDLNNSTENLDTNETNDSAKEESPKKIVNSKEDTSDLSDVSLDNE